MILDLRCLKGTENDLILSRKVFLPTRNTEVTNREGRLCEILLKGSSRMMCCKRSTLQDTSRQIVSSDGKYTKAYRYYQPVTLASNSIVPPYVNRQLIHTQHFHIVMGTVFHKVFMEFLVSTRLLAKSSTTDLS